MLNDACGTAEGSDVAQRMLDALAQPLTVAGKEIFVTCSVGVAAAPEHGDEYPILLRRADAAMYEAKARGRNTIAVHAVRVPESPSDMLDLESALHRAVANDELRVVYQAQVDAQTGTAVAVEALVRWEHPTLGLLSPATFLPIAEESGLIVEMDGWVRRQALAQIRTWTRRGPPVAPRAEPVHPRAARPGRGPRPSRPTSATSVSIRSRWSSRSPTGSCSTTTSSRP